MMNKDQPLFSRLFSLHGKVALITGASGGIGRELSAGLAEAGATVGAHGRNKKKLKETCRKIEKKGGKVLPFTAELSDVEECRKLVSEVRTALGSIDILINCAATNRRKPISDVTLDDFDTIVAVNLRSIFFLSQAVHPIMRAQGGGKIIHIGSMNIFYGLDTVSVYGMTKGGIAQLTKIMAVEWAEDNIQVNCITPGFFLTPLSKPLWNDPKNAKWFTNRIPARRPGNPKELIGVTVLLASGASSYISGQNIVVDGGFLAGGSWIKDRV